MPVHTINAQNEWVDRSGDVYARRSPVDVPCYIAQYYDMVPIGHACEPSESDVEDRSEPSMIDHLHAMSYRELQDMAKEYDVPANQSTEDLINALQDAL